MKIRNIEVIGKLIKSKAQFFSTSQILQYTDFGAKYFSVPLRQNISPSLWGKTFLHPFEENHFPIPLGHDITYQ